jgi:hypothetical protein
MPDIEGSAIGRQTASFATSETARRKCKRNDVAWGSAEYREEMFGKLQVLTGCMRLDWPGSLSNIQNFSKPVVLVLVALVLVKIVIEIVGAVVALVYDVILFACVLSVAAHIIRL